MNQPRVTAGMPLDLLVTKLERSGGGGLSKRQRAALRGLTLLLPHGSAAGLATAGQVGAVVGYSGRWMREGLADLEDLGLVEWHRGGVVDGAPQPSVFRVAKDVLCDLIRRGAEAFAVAAEKVRREVRARLAGRTYKGRRRYNRRSAHAEVGSYLSPSREVTPAAGGAAGRDDQEIAPPERVRDYAASIRSSLKAIGVH